MLTPLSMLQIRLSQLLCLQGDFGKASYISRRISTDGGLQDFPLVPAEIPFKRVRDASRILYSTAIAHKLAARSSLTPAQITGYILNSVSKNTLKLQDIGAFVSLSETASKTLLEPLLQDGTFQATHSGLIQVELSDRAIAGWLNWIIHQWGAGQLWEKGEGWQVNIARMDRRHGESTERWKNCGAETFAMQQTYARCCSLLQMAHREGVITLSQPDAAPALWQFMVPAWIPWLDGNIELRLSHPSERSLIGQFFTVLDETGDGSSQRSWHDYFCLAQQVCQGFQAFHRDRPIWHNIIEQSFELAHAQFGLVMVTQRILYHLLNQRMNISTPSEL